MRTVMDERLPRVLLRAWRARGNFAGARRTLPRLAAVGLLALLAGCASDPIPDVAYYRLPADQRAAPLQSPVFREPLVVDVLTADGVYSSQAILYQTAPEAPVKQYHYQLWQDPPVRLLQRRLISRLRASRIAPVVTDRLPTSIASSRVSGVIERFERYRKPDDSWGVAVQVELRVDRGLDDLPMLLKTYEAELDTENATIQAAVRAFGRGVSQIVDEFGVDLARAYRAEESRDPAHSGAAAASRDEPPR